MHPVPDEVVQCSCPADEDYVNRTINLALSNTTTASNCFNVSIINDNRYELTEEFLVNITTLDHVDVYSYLKIVIVDEDGKFWLLDVCLETSL